MKKNIKVQDRLSQALNPAAHAIVFPKKSDTALIHEFDMLCSLNQAHLISLHESKLLSKNVISRLLQEMRRLKKSSFSDLLKRPVRRGTYLLLENHLIEKLGMKIAGCLHMGRSRNDMNATMFKMNFRNDYANLFKQLLLMRETLLRQAKAYQQMVMPVYSQFQVAQVGTYAYYLLAIEEALSRDQHALKELFFYLDEAPIGAGAGCGTSFPINQKLIASLLGFSKSSKNALDAVAGRDLAVRLMCSLMTIGTNLSRMSQDYQLWTTQEFSFFELPESLCGGSSMMPQKKNPYLFEVIKGKTSILNGVLNQVLSSTEKVPFGNSFEVSIALTGIMSAFQEVKEMLVLAELLIAQATPIQKQLEHSIRKGMAVATAVTELLVKTKAISFREAHEKVGSTITSAIQKQLNPLEEIFKLINPVAKDDNLIFWANMNEYGGGPGQKSTTKAINSSIKRLKKDDQWIKLVDRQWCSAASRLQEETEKLVK